MPATRRVFEDTHATTRLAFAVHAERIIRHFDNPEPSALIPVEGDGIEHQRFCGDEFHFVAFCNMDFV